jgi:glycosyltransferase involved in cell wall biosynthesis
MPDETPAVPHDLHPPAPGADPVEREGRPVLVPGPVGIWSGRGPGRACGVFDYGEHLAAELSRRGLRADLVNAEDWSAAGTLRSVRQLRRARGVVHLQFPSAAFERRLAPYFALAAARGAIRVVTMHEFSRKSRHGQALCRAMFAAADLVVFTSEEERRAGERVFPRHAGKFAVIPIASNVPEHPVEVERTTDLVYFGLIRAGKGIEEFLDAAERLAGPGRTIRLIGRVPDPLPAECAALLERARGLDIGVRLDADLDAVAGELAAARVALLPFPDGMSERRGSALAAMLNGAAVVTTAPDHGRDLFDPLCLMAERANELPSLAERALAGRDEAMIGRARDHARERSWGAIAGAHVAHYARLAERAARR